MADRCYVLALPTGEEVETNDGTPHFTTEKDAREFVERADHEGMETPPTVRQLDAECAMVTCSGCDYTYDEDDSWCVHFESRTEALKLLAGDGWKVIGDEVLCPGCAETEVASDG